MHWTTRRQLNNVVWLVPVLFALACASPKLSDPSGRDLSSKESGAATAVDSSNEICHLNPSTDGPTEGKMVAHFDRDLVSPTVASRASCHAVEPRPMTLPPAEVKWEREDVTFGQFLRRGNDLPDTGTIWRRGTSSPVNDQPHCHAC